MMTTLGTGVVTFATAAEAKAALNAVDMFDIPGLRAEVLSPDNVVESDSDYVSNIFERAAEESSPEVRQVPIPQWFVAYYRNSWEIISALPGFSSSNSSLYPGRTSAVTGKGS